MDFESKMKLAVEMANRSCEFYVRETSKTISADEYKKRVEEMFKLIDSLDPTVDEEPIMPLVG